jgi:hypothetical protein
MSPCRWYRSSGLRRLGNTGETDGIQLTRPPTAPIPSGICGRPPARRSAAPGQAASDWRLP